jgi:hypothetical protein
MTAPKRDPLLIAANLILLFFIAVVGLCAAMLLFGGPAALLFQERLVAYLVAEGMVDAARIFPATGIAFFAIGVLLAACVYFLVLLRRIVRSVGEGDPFIPENATRLSQMGWIALIGQLATIPIGAAVIWIATIVEDSKPTNLEGDFGFDGGGLLLILVLFILARVFRQGTAMREELEGTV